jgi:hypothetical protein
MSVTTVTKVTWLISRETMAVYCVNQTKQIGYIISVDEMSRY